MAIHPAGPKMRRISGVNGRFALWGYSGPGYPTHCRRERRVGLQRWGRRERGMNPKRLTRRAIEKPWGRRDLPPCFASMADGAHPIGEIWFEDKDRKSTRLNSRN